MHTVTKGAQLCTVAIAGCAEAQLTASGAVIGGGISNRTDAVNAFVGGGGLHTVAPNADYGGIAAGSGHSIFNNSTYGIIAGGQANVIGSPGGNFFPSHHGFIGGGRANCIDSSNGATTYGTIAGGELNTIAPGTNHASILGGAGNTVSGSGSAVLGGSGNNDNGFAYAGIFGQNVNGVAANTFHVECLNALNTPIVPLTGPHPSGTIVKWDTTLGPLPVGYLPLYIAP